MASRAKTLCLQAEQRLSEASVALFVVTQYRSTKFAHYQWKIGPRTIVSLLLPFFCCEVLLRFFAVYLARHEELLRHE